MSKRKTDRNHSNQARGNPPPTCLCPPRGFPSESAKRRRRRSAAEAADSRARFKAAIDAAPQKQEDLDKLLDKAGVILMKTHRRPPKYQGLIDQRKAALERIWRPQQARKLRREVRETRADRPVRIRTYSLTLARPVWIRGDLDPAMLPLIRKQVQRQVKRNPRIKLFTGSIDVCPMRDDKSGVRGWAFHVHATALVAAVSTESGRKSLKKTFPVKSDSGRGVPKPRVVTETYAALPWDLYQDKVLQFREIRQRITRVDARTGKRKKTKKPPLTKAQELEWIRFMALVKPEDFAIWVGYRRYGNEVRKVGVSPTKKQDPTI